ncbi:MAG: pyridoxal phosphate-dependent aminotransferase [Christensenellales bacterium]|jgi:aspartate aminotransferase
MKLSERVLKIQGSITLSIDAKAKAMKAQGEDIIGLGAGEPDLDTPDIIKQAAKEALDKGFTKYTPVAGMMELRQAISDRLKSEGLCYMPQEIVVSNGGKHSLYNIFATILNPLDEVLIPLPYWVSYPEMIQVCGGVAVFVETDEKSGFTLDIKKIEEAITPKTKAIVINSPSNPTGAVYTKEQLEAVAQLAQKHGFFVISDEIYSELLYEGGPFFSIGQLPGMKEHVIISNGMSKVFSMTGWRIGFTAAPEPIAKAMTNFQSHTTSNPNSIAQYASVAGLNEVRDEVKNMRREFDRRRTYMSEAINGIEGLSCVPPKGAFYIFMNVRGAFGKSVNGQPIHSSMDFADVLLQDQKVAVVPGIAFGNDHYVRLSYATSMENIERAIQRLSAFMAKLQPIE